MSIVLNENLRLPEIDGEINLIYGPIGGGKNTLATGMILKSLRAGKKVFATWPINFDGVDETRSLFAIVLGILGLKRKYRKYSSKNFTYITLKEMMSDDFMKKLSMMTDCEFYVDEAYAARLFDSYRKTHLSVEERMAVYITRHVNRKFVIVAQRPNAIHVSSRSMVNRFYKCEQLLPMFITRIVRGYVFRRTEFQDMIDESVNEENPYSTKLTFVRYGSEIFKMFDSKYMRDGREALYPPQNQEYYVSYFSRWSLLLRGLSFGRKARLSAPAPIKSPIQPNKPSGDVSKVRSIRDITKN